MKVGRQKTEVGRQKIPVRCLRLPASDFRLRLGFELTASLFTLQNLSFVT